jgi:hypothetical protein
MSAMAAIRGRRRVDGEVHAPDDPFVRAPVVAALHVDANDLSEAASVASRQQQERLRQCAASHSRHSQRKWITFPVINAPRQNEERDDISDLARLCDVNQIGRLAT